MALITSVTGAFVSVRDFAPHLDFWCGQLGWEVRESGVIAADVASSVYGVDAPIEVQVLCAGGSDVGQVYLIKTANSASLDPRFTHTSELGYHGLDVYTKDGLKTYGQLVDAGYEWAGKPEAYGVPIGDKVVEIMEGFCFGPEGTAVVFVEAKNARVTRAWEKDPELPYTELTSVVCAVRDVDALTKFFGPEGLGLSKWYDVTFSSPELEKITQLPEGSNVRLVFLAGPETARIEILRVENVEPPHDLRAVQRPGKSLGQVGWSFRTLDLDGALSMVEARGGRLLSKVTLTEDPIHGRARVASAETPEGAFIEFWQIA
jgi:hypothetical protein